MTHRATTTTPRAVIGSPWFIRKAVYLAVGLVGLVAVAFGIVSPCLLYTSDAADE